MQKSSSRTPDKGELKEATRGEASAPGDSPDTSDIQMLDPELLEPLEEAQASAPGEAPQSAETSTLKPLEQTTVQSESLELNTFAEAEEIDESEVFSTGSFGQLKSLDLPAPPTLDPTEDLQDTGEEEEKKSEPKDPSVENFLAGVGVKLRAKSNVDHDATHSLRQRLKRLRKKPIDQLSEEDKTTPGGEVKALDEPPGFSAPAEKDEQKSGGPPALSAGLAESTDPEIVEWDAVEVIEETPDTAAALPAADEAATMTWERMQDADLSEASGPDDEWDDVGDTEYQLPDQALVPQMDPDDFNADEQRTVLEIDAHWLDEDSEDAQTLNEIDVGSELGFGAVAAQGPQPPGPASDLAQTPTRGGWSDAQTPARPAQQSGAQQPARPGAPWRETAEEYISAARQKLRPLAQQLSDSGMSARLKLIVPAAILLFGLLIIGLGVATSSSSYRAISQRLERWEMIQSVDIYQNYLAGEALLEQAVNTRGFMGAPGDAILGTFGLMKETQKARARAYIELAFLKAFIEYRFEYAGTHGAEKSIADADRHAPDEPLVDVARAYELMARGEQDEAIKQLRRTRRQNPELKEATIALIHAQLDADQLEAAVDTARELREQETLNVHEHYLLGLIDLKQGDRPLADARMRHITEILSPDHIGARISRVYSTRGAPDSEENERAESLVEEVLAMSSAHISPLELAQTHIARGYLQLSAGAAEQAEKDFQQALKLIPQRSQVYVPIVKLFERDGRMDKALELITHAADAGVTSVQLDLASAEIYRLTGRPELALQTVGALNAPSAHALWIKGMAQLEMGQFERAKDEFRDAREKNERFAPARAYFLLIEELENTHPHNKIDTALEKLLERHPEDPHVLRAAGRALMHVARVADEADARPGLLERAESLLKKALDRQANPFLIYFDLCEHALLSGDAAGALAQCEEAHQINARYLPGVVIMADLLLTRGGSEKYPDFFEKIAEDNPKDAAVSHYRALYALDHHQLEDAEAEINRWAGTPAAKTALHLYAEGRLAFERDDFRRALGYFQSARQADPALTPAALYYALTLTRLGEHRRAEVALAPVLNDLVWEPVSWIIFAEVRRNQERFKDAHQNISLALKSLDTELLSPRWITELYVQSALTWAEDIGYDADEVLEQLELAGEEGLDTEPSLQMALSQYHLALDPPDQAAASAALEELITTRPHQCSALESLRTIYSDLDASKNLERIETQLNDHQCES